MKPVAIIGGGISGLTAAFRLQQQGIPATIYETGARVGGVIRSIREDGYLAEFGPNSVLETSPVIGSLIRDLKLEGRRCYSDPRAENRYLVRGHKLILLPSSPPAFFASPLFSWGAKLRLCAEPFIRRAPAAVEESLAQFVVRRLGQEFLDYAINPLVAGVYAGDPAQLSVREAFPKLHALEQKYGSLILGQFLGARERKRRGEVAKDAAPKFSFGLGLQELIDTFESRLLSGLKLSTHVLEVEKRVDRWTISFESGGQVGAADHSAVLCALPAYRMAELNITADRPVNLTSLAGIHYPPVASVVLGFRREDVAHPLDGFGMLIPEKENLRILGSIFSSSLFPNRAPLGHVTITSYVGGCRAPALAQEGRDQIFATVLKDLSILLGVKGQPTYRHLAVFPKAIPQYELGFGHYRELMARAETTAPGLFIAGHARDGISLGDSIVSGDRAATRIAGFLGREGEAARVPPAPLEAAA